MTHRFRCATAGIAKVARDVWRLTRWQRAAAPLDLRARTTRHLGPSCAATAIALTGLAWIVWHDAQRVRATQAEAVVLAREVANAQRHSDGAHGTGAPTPAVPSAHVGADTARALALLDRLGPALSPDIALRRIEVTADAGTARLGFEARDVDGMIAFATRLEPTFDIQWHHSARKAASDAPVVEASMTLTLRAQVAS